MFIVLAMNSFNFTSGKGSNPIRVAVEAWVESFIKEVDYNQSNWSYHFHSVSQSIFFDHYVRKLSDIFKQSNAQVNFVMVGACRINITKITNES
jgi:hypothetical protein